MYARKWRWYSVKFQEVKISVRELQTSIMKISGTVYRNFIMKMCFFQSHLS